MKKFTKISAIFVLALVMTVSLVPTLASAQATVDEGRETAVVGPQDIDGVIDILNRILGWLYTIFFIAAAGFILLGAFVYLTAAGNEDNIKEAKNYFLYSIIAIVVALVAFGVDNIVESIITG